MDRQDLARVAMPAAFAAALPAGAIGAYWGIRLASTSQGRRLLERSVLWRVRTDQPLVALTFDDGPDLAYTPLFIEALDGIRATFFSLGMSTRLWAHLVRDLVEAGHEVGCHGDTHRTMTRVGPRATIEALRRARDAVAEAAGTPPRFYRPAFGRFNLASWVEAPRLGMRRTLWTAGGRDWEDESTPELIASRILEAAEPGAIFFLHDSDGGPGAPGRTLEAIPAIRQGLEAKGLESVTLSELVAAEAPEA